MIATRWAKRRAVAVLLALLPLLMVVGCGKPKGTVTGTVKYKDKDGTYKPMPGGTIAFIPVESGGRGGTFDINPDNGTYTTANMTAGTMKVIVKPAANLGGGGDGGGRSGPGGGPPKSVGDKGKPPTSGGPPEEVRDKLDPSKGKGKYVPINKKYQNENETPLEFTVEKGEQTKDFEVD